VHAACRDADWNRKKNSKKGNGKWGNGKRKLALESLLVPLYSVNCEVTSVSSAMQRSHGLRGSSDRPIAYSFNRTSTNYWAVNALKCMRKTELRGIERPPYRARIYKKATCGGSIRPTSFACLDPMYTCRNYNAPTVAQLAVYTVFLISY